MEGGGVGVAPAVEGGGVGMAPAVEGGGVGVALAVEGGGVGVAPAVEGGGVGVVPGVHIKHVSVSKYVAQTLTYGKGDAKESYMITSGMQPCRKGKAWPGSAQGLAS